MTSAAAIEGCRALRVARRPARLRLQGRGQRAGAARCRGRAPASPGCAPRRSPQNEPVLLLAFGEEAGRRSAQAAAGIRRDAGRQARGSGPAPARPGRRAGVRPAGTACRHRHRQPVRQAADRRGRAAARLCDGGCGSAAGLARTRRPRASGCGSWRASEHRRAGREARRRPCFR